MPLIPFPNVPNDPGVPPIPRGVTQSTLDIISLVTGGGLPDPFGGVLFGANSDAQQWGFFDESGEPLIIAETVLAFEVVKESRISTYPVEEGGFQSYNKVETPGQVRVRYVTGATLEGRTDLIESVSAACRSLDAYTAIMPEKIFESVNLTHYETRRETNNGVGVLVVEVWGEEIRDSASAEFTNTSDASGAAGTTPTTEEPSGADPQTVGPVQPEKLTGEDKAAVGDGPSGMPITGATDA